MLPPMLAELDAIDWNSLSHARGSAQDVPEMLRSMASDDADARRAAFIQAYGNIWFEGTVFEATAKAVPFLVELAAVPAFPDRHRVLELLFQIAHGRSPAEGELPDDDVGFSLVAEPTFNSEIGEEMTWVQAAAAAVAAGRPVYVGLLEDPAPEVRRYAARLLTCCPDHRAEVLGPLIHTFESDDDPGARATALYAIAVLAASEEEALIDRGLKDDQPLVQLSAALSASFFLGESPSAEAVETLIPFLEHPDRVRYEELVFGEDCASDIGAALARVDESRRTEVAERLLAIAEAGEAEALTVSAPILQLAFGAPQPEPSLSELPPVGRRALSYVAGQAFRREEDGDWSSFTPLVLLLEEYGLVTAGQQAVAFDP